MQNNWQRLKVMLSGQLEHDKNTLLIDNDLNTDEVIGLYKRIHAYAHIKGVMDSYETEGAPDTPQPDNAATVGEYYARNHYVLDGNGNDIEHTENWFPHSYADQCANILNIETARLRADLQTAKTQNARQVNLLIEQIEQLQERVAELERELQKKIDIIAETRMQVGNLKTNLSGILYHVRELEKHLTPVMGALAEEQLELIVESIKDALDS